jgi:hypothetical protein
VTQPPPPTLKSVAVLPFQNAGTDRSFDYLSLPLADEVAMTLSYARGLSVQPFLTTSQYALPGVDLRKAAEPGHRYVVPTHSGHVFGNPEPIHMIEKSAFRPCGRDMGGSSRARDGRYTAR